ncbi:MAG: metal-dependent transcriptional regulator [Candidatus Omnitrophota bacterium]
MPIDQKKLEEALSCIWEYEERRISDSEEIKNRLYETGLCVYEDMIEAGYIRQSGNKVSFTDKGSKLAKDVIRRQRLAERLLIDVLEIKKESVDSIACEFEHIISQEVEKSICILLGHPKICPHGSRIPAGDCCRAQQPSVASIVVTLDKLKSGETSKVVYMVTHGHPELHKLLSLGVVPGVVIKIHQTFPTFVIEVDQQQIALDSEIAREIYVKRL